MDPGAKSDRVRFPFNERKAAAAAAFLLDHEGGTMDYMRLVKLLYLAERESLARLSHPIAGDVYSALDQGPILSRVLDLCKYKSTGPWAAQIERSGLWAVKLRKPPDLGPLSAAEVAILEEVAKRFHERDQWDLSTLMRGLPEWNDPRGGRLEILLEEVLVAVGKTTEETREMLDEAIEGAQLAAAFCR